MPNYTEAYDTDYDTTIDNFVTTHAATLLARDLVVTNGGSNKLTITSNIAGQPFTAPAFASGSDIGGSVAATTANTAPSDLASDEAIGYLRSMYENQPAVLRKIEDSYKRLYVDYRVLDNYQESLEDGGVNTEIAKKMVINGIERFTYRGIPIIPHNWYHYLSTDFPHASGQNPALPHRFVLTIPNNLVVGINAMDEFNKMEFWYNKDEQENRFRVQMKFGVNYVHNQLFVVAY